MVSLKQILLRLLVSKNAKVKFSPGVIIDRRTIFEGLNAIQENSKIYNSVIGRGTYIGSSSIVQRAKIGRFCSIGSNVLFATGTHPTSQFVSTHPAFYSTRKQAGFTFATHQIFDEDGESDGLSGMSITIGNDVWIGASVTILSGVKIGNGAIIASGSVVYKDVESYSIVAGNPLRVVRMRFDDQTISELENTRWWDFPIDVLNKEWMQFSDITLFLNNS